MSKYFSRLGTITIASLVVAAGIVYAATYYRLNNTTVTQVDEWGYCGIINNGSGQDMFVPTNSSAEWTTFLSHLPAGVSKNNTCITYGNVNSGASAPLCRGSSITPAASNANLPSGATFVSCSYNTSSNYNSTGMGFTATYNSSTRSCNVSVTCSTPNVTGPAACGGVGQCTAWVVQAIIGYTKP